MKVTIKVEGEIATKREKIEAELDVPDSWAPTWVEYSKVRGTLRMLEEKMAQHFEPKAENN